mgnify:CR=1 FL=1
MSILAALGGIGTVFSAISGLAQGWFKHKQAKTEAARDIELATISAGVEIQKGSWKDEYFTIFWTWPLYPVIAEAMWKMDPNIFIAFVIALPVWYQTILIGMTTASFGMKTIKDWKAGVLDREMTWDRHEKNGAKEGPAPPGKIAPAPPPDYMSHTR